MSIYLTIAVALYIAIGIGFLFYEFVKSAVDKAVNDLWRRSFIDAVRGKPPIPRFKFMLFRFVLSLATVIFWPILLPSIKRESQDPGTRVWKNQATAIPKENGLRFEMMGGAGQLLCDNCEYSQEIISFIHGVNTCTMGYQCQSCGRLVNIKDSFVFKASTTCECGGILSRDSALFCPACRSRALHYNMRFIT